MALTSDQTLVAERPLYFHADPGLGTLVDGGHDVVWPLAPARSFLFPEVTVRPGFVEHVPNPFPTRRSSDLTLSFQAADDGGAPVAVPDDVLAVPARARVTVNV